MTKLSAPFIIAHRGASYDCPENTLISLETAFQQGVSWVEFDVMLTQDYHPILMHDITLDRTTNFKGEVHSFTWHELQKADAGSWFSDRFQNIHIPSFIDVIEFLKAKQLKAVIEIKPCIGYELKTAEVIYQSLCKHWPMFREHTILSSFNHETLSFLRDRDAEIDIGVSIEYLTDRALHFAEQVNASSIHIDYEHLDLSQCQRMIERNFHILAYTVNKPDLAKQLFSWGVSAIFSDIPDIMQKMVE